MFGVYVFLVLCLWPAGNRKLNTYLPVKIRWRRVPPGLRFPPSLVRQSGGVSRTTAYNIWEPGRLFDVLAVSTASVPTAREEGVGLVPSAAPPALRSWWHRSRSSTGWFAAPGAPIGSIENTKPGTVLHFPRPARSPRSAELEENEIRVGRSDRNLKNPRPH